MRWIVVLIPVFLAACSASITLGSECPEIDGRCPRIGFGDDAAEPEADAALRDAGRSSDAGARDAQAGDAAPVEDAAAHDAGGTSDAQIESDGAAADWLINGSFELQNGATAPTNLNSFGQSRALEPWYGCRDGLDALAEYTLGDGVTKVRPTDGATFFVDSMNAPTTSVSGLAQDLSKPLRAGQSYAFSVDLWSEPGLLQGELELQVASGTLMMFLGAAKCVLSGITIIGHSAPVAPGGWRPMCVKFTAPSDISSVTLMAGPVQQQIFNVNFGAHLFIDNIRVVPDCP